jgi:hypothetical protein
MNQIYHVEGIVNSGFVGQITYMVSLERPYTELDIHLTYDFAELRYRTEDMTDAEFLDVFGPNREPASIPLITPEVIEETKKAVKIMSGCDIDNERVRKILIREIDLKTEIHPLVMLNDQFVGCVHRQIPDRHLIFKGDFATEGCIPQEKFEGVLKITVLVFNVVKDNTHYTLTVSGN